MGKTDCKWEPAKKHRKCFISAIDDLEELGARVRREVQDGGNICIHIADSLHCTAESNTTLQSSYTPIKKEDPGFLIDSLNSFYIGFYLI